MKREGEDTKFFALFARIKTTHYNSKGGNKFVRVLRAQIYQTLMPLPGKTLYPRLGFDYELDNH